MSNILFISPYTKLSLIAEKIISEENIDVEILDADVLNLVNDQGAKELIKKISKETKVVVSRGMIAKIVRDYTSLPVVEIPITTFDILDAISTVSNKRYEEVAIIYVSNMLSSPVNLKSIGSMNFHFIPIDSMEDAKRISTEESRDEKYDAVIGDALACEIANANGFHGVLLESNEKTLKIALNDARKIVKQLEAEQNLKIKSRRKINDMGWVAKYSFNDILGQSDEIRNSIYWSKKFAKSDRNVIIYGETGTGKELFAQSIHNQSNRLYEPFIPINCGAMSESLLESELFGYEAGAFTGSNKEGKEGIFECASKGTVFLDEISETSLSFQAKLLRVLQERSVRKIGGQKVIDIDVRIVCATNKNLSELVKQNIFREDVFYRLNQLELRIAPLRERKKDILIIAEYYFDMEMELQKKYISYKDNSVFEPLLKYEWPGNVRELRNFMLKLVIFCETTEITNDFIEFFFNNNFLNYKKPEEINNAKASMLKEEKDEKIQFSVSNDMGLMESEMYKQLLKYYKGDKKKLCDDYCISRTKLWRKINNK
jgi:transcriptional regulator with PAS, ATPase and Fis domain